MKTKEEILNEYIPLMSIIPMPNEPSIYAAMEEYASQFYTPTEVAILIKQVLDDAAERATVKTDSPTDYDNFWVDKESITNISIDKYLTK